jgi:adenylate cyclase
MFMGNVGSARRLDYTVIGTEVNISQRLASAATSFRIYITDEVRKDLARKEDKKILFEDLGAMTLKGVHYPVSAFCVLGIDKTGG